MTKISQIYAALETVIETELPTYRKIPNPYDSSANANVILRQGYGIVAGAGSNTNRVLGCEMSIARDFGVILTKQIAKTEHDADGRTNQEKALFEDQYLLVKSLEKNPSLTGTAAKVGFVGDNGIEVLDLETGRYFVLVSQFNVEYFENLT